MCSRGSDQQVQRPWGRDLLGISRNIVKASVAGVGWNGEEERMGKCAGRKAGSHASGQGAPFSSLLLLPSILAQAHIPEQGWDLSVGRKGLGLGIPSPHLLCAGDSAELWAHIRSPHPGTLLGENRPECQALNAHLSELIRGCPQELRRP